MLFDLRARGRRRTVQAVYLGLAIIFLLGFLGFGVGVGSGGGGIFNFLSEEKSAGGASFTGKAEAALARTRRHPNDPAAWAALTEAQLHEASEPQYFDVVGESEQFNTSGKALLAKISDSWNTYLRLQPHHGDAELAFKVSRILYSEQALNQPTEEARALQVAIAGKPPSGTLYASLAAAAYKARHIPEGDAALHKAIPLVPAEERKKVKQYLEELRKNPVAHVPVTVNKSANGTYVATQAGKTATVKKTGKGTFTGVGGPAASPSSTSTAKRK